MTTDTEKWKARAREIVGSPLSPQGEYITAHGWMKLQEQIAAALAAAYAAGIKGQHPTLSTRDIIPRDPVTGEIDYGGRDD